MTLKEETHDCLTASHISEAYSQLTDLVRQFEKEYDIDPEEGMSTDFQKWWNLYPTHDGHAHYERTRALKMSKDLCRALYEKAAKEHGSEELLSALEKEVRSRKLRSSQSNELSWMKTSINYLESGSYEAWLEDTTELSLPVYTHRAYGTNLI